MRLYLIAFQFLTIIPVPFTTRCEAKDLGRSMALFPLVGLTLGGLLAGADFLLSRFLPGDVRGILLIALLSVVTGALHLDGLADVCDGLAARGGRGRFLEVMKDSRVGAVGVVGLVLGLLLKYQALIHVPPELRREALLVFPTVARFSQVQMAVWARGARPDGLGSIFVAGAGGVQFAVAFLFTLLIAFLLLGLNGLYLVAGLFLITWLLKIWFHGRLGGVTGDVIGCVSEINEIVCLVTMLAMFGGNNP